MKIFVPLLIVLTSSVAQARLTGTNPTGASADVDCQGKKSAEQCTDYLGNIIPTTANAQTLGTSALPWSNIYLSNGAIDTAKIANGSINTDKLAADAVTAVKILAGSINTSKLASGAVNTAKLLLSGPVDTTKILCVSPGISPQVGFYNNLKQTCDAIGNLGSL